MATPRRLLVPIGRDPWQYGVQHATMDYVGGVRPALIFTEGVLVDDSWVDAAEIARLAEELFAVEKPTETVEQVAMLARDELEVDVVSITVSGSDGTLETRAATDPLGEAVDRLQQEVGEGPCLDAEWSRHAMIAHTLHDDPRWPVWGTKAAELGVTSVLALPLASGEHRIGALNLFSTQEREFSDEDIAFAHIFARHATLAIVAARKDAHMVVALDGRKLIGQAQGILMERYGLDDTRAFEILKRYSQNHNVKLREVAARLVATRRLPDGH